MNVRGIDRKTGRRRLSTRSGLSTFLSTRINASSKIDWLEQITYNNLKTTYALNSPATEVWSAPTPDLSGGISAGAFSCQVSARGDLYVLSRASTSDGASFWRYNSDGVLLSTTTIPLKDSSGQCEAFFVDAQDDVWVGVSTGSALTGGRALLFRYQLQDDGSHKLMWKMRSGSASNNVEFIRCIYVKDNILYTLQSDLDVSTPTLYMRSYRNIRELFAPEEVDLDIDVNTALSSTCNSGDIAVKKSGAVIVTCIDQVGTVNTYLAKFNPNGVLVSGWTKSGLVDGGGIGGAVALDSEGNVYTMGVAMSDNNYLRKWTDNGQTLASTWIVDDANNTTQAIFQKIRVDEWDNLIVPFTRSISDAAWTEWRIYDSSGALVLGTNTTGAVNNVAIPPKNPEYDPDASPDVPEFVYTVGQGMEIKKWRTASAVATTGSTRTTKLLSLAGGEVRLFDSTSLGSSLGTIASTGDWSMTTVQFGKVYIADGETYYVVDPVAETMEELKSSTSGEIPRRCLLLSSWRGRLVLSGDPDDRHNWHMSAAGDATNWDQIPPIVTATTAVSGNNAEQVGRVPDIINCLIPYSDDVFLFGCDHSIYMLRGDPMAGGTLDLVNDQVGMAFGKPWCRGPDGRIYFFGSRGGVYAMHPYTGATESLTQFTIERRMLDVDLTAYYPRLAWNWRDEGLHVILCPYASGTATHWFWDAKNAAWWEDSFGVQPTAVIVSDGDDPDDRLLILGTATGYAAKWDKDADDDLGVSAKRTCLYGPFQGAELTYQLKVRDFTAVLSDTQDGCIYEFYVNDRPDDLPTTPSADGVLYPGRNVRRPVRARGTSVWMRLTFSGSGAVEHINANYELGGRARVRA